MQPTPIYYVVYFYYIAVLRFGKSFDFLYGALKSMHIEDSVLRITITLSRINQALYLFFDHLLWIDRVGLYKVDRQRWSELSARFWVGTLVLNLARNSYDIWQIILREYKCYSSQSRKDDLDVVNQNKKISFEKVLVKSLLENRPVMLDFIKNATDIFLPLSTLGKVNVSPGFQGVMGIVSSTVGIMTVWDPLLKLVP